MNRDKVVMILALVLTMKAATEQDPPLGCICTNGTISHRCYTRGCSVGPANPDCNAAIGDIGAVSVINGFFTTSTFYIIYFDFGCNCPGSPHNGTNGYARVSGHDDGVPFNYTTCTDFNSDRGDAGRYLGHDVTDCCNYCCNRTDPYAPTISVGN